MLNKIKRVIRFFVNLLNTIMSFVVRFKGAVVIVQCHVQIVYNP